MSLFNIELKPSEYELNQAADYLTKLTNCQWMVNECSLEMHTKIKVASCKAVEEAIHKSLQPAAALGVRTIFIHSNPRGMRDDEVLLTGSLVKSLDIIALAKAYAKIGQPKQVDIAKSDEMTPQELAQMLTYSFERSPKSISDGTDTSTGRVTERLVVSSAARTTRQFTERFPGLLSEQSGKDLSDALQFTSDLQSHTDKEILDRIMQGLPTFIVGRFHGDCPTILIWKDRFVVCYPSVYAPEIYRFDPGKLTEDSIRMFRISVTEDIEGHKSNFYAALESKLSLKVTKREQCLNTIVELLFDTGFLMKGNLANWRWRAFENALRLYFLLDKFDENSFVLQETPIQEVKKKLELSGVSLLSKKLQWLEKLYPDDIVNLSMSVDTTFQYWFLFQQMQLLTEFTELFGADIEAGLIFKGLRFLCRMKSLSPHTIDPEFTKEYCNQIERFKIKLNEDQVGKTLLQVFKEVLATIPAQNTLLDMINGAVKMKFDFATGAAAFLSEDGKRITVRPIDEKDLLALFMPQNKTTIYNIARTWGSIPISDVVDMGHNEHREFWNEIILFRESAFIKDLFQNCSILFVTSNPVDPEEFSVKMVPGATQPVIRITEFFLGFFTFRQMVLLEHHLLSLPVETEISSTNINVLKRLQNFSNRRWLSWFACAQLFAPDYEKVVLRRSSVIHSRKKY